MALTPVPHEQNCREHEPKYDTDTEPPGDRNVGDNLLLQNYQQNSLPNPIIRIVTPGELLLV